MSGPLPRDPAPFDSDNVVFVSAPDSLYSISFQSETTASSYQILGRLSSPASFLNQMTGTFDLFHFSSIVFGLLCVGRIRPLSSS